jgi:hypothetical protein
MQNKMVFFFTIILIILGSNFAFAQEEKPEQMIKEDQQVTMPSMMKENMKMMGDMMGDMSKMIEGGHMSGENQKQMCNMMKNMGCMMNTMESGCGEGTLRQHKEELSSYQKELKKMADEF